MSDQPPPSPDDVDPSETGLGEAIIPGHDLDGDGTPDLLVGENFWDGDPHILGAPFGRFMVYRGEVGG